MRSSRWTLIGGFLAGALVGCGDDPVGPLLEAVLPARGAPGEVVDLVGERFEGALRGASFGGQQAVVVEWQARRARVQVPALGPGATSVVVTVDGRVSAPRSFTVEGTVRLDRGP
jgi:hypothetical protein